MSKTRGGNEQKDFVETFTYSFAAEMKRIFRFYSTLCGVLKKDIRELESKLS